MQYKSTLEKLPKSEVKLLVEVPWEELVPLRDTAITELAKGAEFDGFRKGKAPKEVVEKKLSPMVILEEMAHSAINELYGKLVVEHKVDAIGYPKIHITKIAEGNPLEFTLITAVIPELTLPDYKKIAKNTGEKVEVLITDEDVEKTIEDLRKMRQRENAHMKMHEDGNTDNHDHGEVNIENEPLPELTDEFVKTLGDFENISDFKEKIKKNMALEKEHGLREKNRVAILEKVLEETKGEIPELFVESELDKMMMRMKSDISNMGISFEEYLKHLKKSEEEVRNEWQGDAEKRAKMELILHKISEQENIVPNKEEVEKQVASLLEMYKGADKERTKAYVEMTLANEEVFKLLEAQIKE